MLQNILLFLHLCAVALWVGGMAVMYFAVRPSAVESLEPLLRLPFLVSVIGRFFNLVSGAILVLLASGAGLILALDGHVPVFVHAMLGMGLLMMAIFGHLRFAVYPRLSRSVAAQDWPQAAGHLATIRRLMELNLALGVMTIAVTTLAR